MRRRVLLVAEESATREVFEEYLDDAGYDVAVVPTAEDALDVVHDFGAQAVLCDIALHGADALDLTAHLRIEGSHVPVLLFSTSDADASGLGSGLLVGLDGVHPASPLSVLEARLAMLIGEAWGGHLTN